MTDENELVKEEAPTPTYEEVIVQVPSVGRAVHYIAHGSLDGTYPSGVRRAATVTGVDTPGDPYSAISLMVANPSGLFFNQHVPFSEGDVVGTWAWPEYVPPVKLKKLRIA